MPLVELTAVGNEASDLLRVRDPRLLSQLNARAAYWTVLNEGPVEQCLALLVLSHDGVWSAHHVAADAGELAGRTEDAEALAWRDGWVYVFGSHFGKKKGPLRPRRAFVARFRESMTPVLDIVRHRFALHRSINDALTGLTGTAAPGVRESFIAATMRRGLDKGKSWVAQLTEADHPINIEGAAFTSSGSLLAGLRSPVTAEGLPILVELDLEWGQPPRVLNAYAIDVGPGPLGVRALSARPGGDFDVVIGSIDALDKGSVLLDEHPHARDATCRHFRFALTGDALIKPDLVADLAPLHHVEGASESDDGPVYVTDEDHRIAVYGPAR